MAPIARKTIKRKPKTIGRRTILKAQKKVHIKKANLQPGQVLILLSGGHRGKRVVFLKQLGVSGLLLVTGPFKVNGVPIRRVNRRYVIATSTHVDVKGVKVDQINDEFFGKTKKEKFAEKRLNKKSAKESESIFMDQSSDEKTKQNVPEKKKKIQDAVDATILASLQKEKMLTQYLKTKFTLRSGHLPHEMKF